MSIRPGYVAGMASMTLNLFGTFEGTIGDRLLPRFRSKKGQVLLALLVLRHGREVSRDWLCEALWPESFGEQARLSLRQSLADLRKALGEESIRIDSLGTHGIRLTIVDARVDVVEFDRIADLENPSVDDLDRAISLYRGPFLEGHRDDALIAERESRVTVLIRLLTARAAIARRVGDLDCAIAHLHRAASLNPLNQAPHRQMMELLAENGRLGEALEVYRRLSETLRTQFEALPEETTEAVFRDLRASVVAEHRSVSRPSEGTSISGSAMSLAGREVELLEVESLLAERRLVTITGLGGIGKSVLSVEAARRYGAHSGRSISFVSLVNETRGVSLEQHLRSATNAPDRTGLYEWLAQSPRLLVLDNCELDLDPLGVLLPDLLAGCPNLTILATSRLRLGLADEVVFALRPLAVPSIDADVAQLEATPSCALLIERIRQSNPTWRPKDAEIRAAAEVCRLLEGLPLAIELAAAQARVLTLSELQRRLASSTRILRSDERHRPERHRSLDVVLGDSYAMLDEVGKRTLRVLSIFVEGFSLEAAEAVVGTEDVLSGLTGLIDASLVQVVAEHDAEPRYRMLETIRRFGMDLLREHGELDAVRIRHAGYFRSLTQGSINGLLGRDQATWLRRIEADYGNIRAALSETPDNETFVALIANLTMYWHICWHTDEVLHWLSAAFTRTEGVPLVRVARLHYAEGLVRWQRMELEMSQKFFESSLDISIESGDPASIGASYSWISNVQRLRGDLEGAYQSALRGVEAFVQRGSVPRTARARTTLARAAAALGRFEEAESLFRQSLDDFFEIGDVRDYAQTQQSLASTLAEMGRLEEARALHRVSLGSLVELNDPLRIGYGLAAIARFAELNREFQTAALLLGGVAALEKKHGFEIASRYRRPTDAATQTLAQNLPNGEFVRLVQTQASRPLPETLTLALEVCGE